MVTTIDGNEKVTGQMVVMCLGPNSNLTDIRFEAAQKTILCWNIVNVGAPQFLWDNPLGDQPALYLSSVDEILEFKENCSSLSDTKLLDRVESVLQMAMSRLEHEFRHMLVTNTVPLDCERISGGSFRRISLSFTSIDGAGEDFESSVDDESLCEEEDVSIELIKADAVVNLKKIAERMISAGYEKECCQVYTRVRRDVLSEYLSVLGIEKMSIEDVQKSDWGTLDEKMRRWIQAIKVFVKVILFSEKQLCGRVFDGSERIRGVCFVETAKGCVLQLLNFGEAIVVGQRACEKLFRILDMYDTLANVLLELKAQFGSDENVCIEAERVLAELGEAAKGTFAVFEKAVQSEVSKKTTQGGEVHPLARYVMNYIKLLLDYSDCMNSLFQNSTTTSHSTKEGATDASSELGSISTLARRMLLLISSLESNIEEKSKLYLDGGMRYIFLMNNLLYIVQKVKESELGKLLGDNWVRVRRSQIRQYATGYLRVCWSKVLPLLKDEGIVGKGSSSGVSKVALKERFKTFNAAYEEIYKTQTAWKVPDAQLREELRISISEKVLPAYRSFVGRFRGHLENERHVGKYIKYFPEDLENHLADLFEGSPKVLNHTRRKLGR